MGLGKLLQGVGGDVTTGLALGAFMGNPLLGLLAAPYLNQKRRTGDANREGIKADTAGQELENERMRERATTVENLPGLLSALNSTGVMAPGAKNAQSAQIAANVPSLAPHLLGNKDSRANQSQQMLGMAEQYLGRRLNEDEAKQFFGLNSNGNPMLDAQMMEMQLRLAKLMREETAAADALKTEDEISLTTREDLTHNLEMMETSMDALQGSLLAPGGGFIKDIAEMFMPAAEWAAKAVGRGETAEAIQQQREAAALLGKSSARFIGNSLQLMNQRGINVTRGLQSLVENMSANPDMPIGSIRVINQMAAQELLRNNAQSTLKLASDEVQFLTKLASGFDGQFGTIEEAQVAINQGLIKEGDTFHVKGVAHTATR